MKPLQHPALALAAAVGLSVPATTRAANAEPERYVERRGS